MKFNLTAIELTVLEKVANGKKNKEIAKELSISEDEVKELINDIFSKLNVNNRLQAILKYYL